MDTAAIGPYRIVDRLGAGGMGEVFLAFDTRLDRKVALKSLTGASLGTPHTRERLLREARAAAHITHPNIAAIYDVLDAGEPPFIVMEYAQGETLSAIAARGAIGWRDVLKIALQLTDAVAHAHAAGVIHRDLKPLNVVLTPDGTVKVLDFGLARVGEPELRASSSEAVTGEQASFHRERIAGTTAYMAPELFVGGPAGPLSDIYGLGATLYELLTGKRPFEAASTPDLIRDIVSKPTPSASNLNPAVPSWLDAIVTKAMARDPAGRYQSAADMAADLRQVEQELRSGSRSEALGDLIVSGKAPDRAAASRTHRIAIVAAALAVVTLAATAYLAWRGGARTGTPPSSQSVAVLPFAAEAGQPVTQSDAAGYTEAVVGALEGLSSVGVVTRRAHEVLYLQSAGDLRKQAIALGVTLIIHGKVSQTGSSRRVAITVEKPDGVVVLSKAYVGTADRTSDLQAQAVHDIVSVLNVPLTPADRERLKKVPACRPETYTALAAGRAALERPDAEVGLGDAESIFAEAVQKDPACALAQAGLADARVALYGRTRVATWMNAAEQPILAARSLDRDSPAIKLSLARYYVQRGMTVPAELVIRDVIALRPFDDTTHRVLAEIFESQERIEEALAELQIAVNLRPGSVVNRIALGNLQWSSGRYADALQSYQAALRIQPNNSWATSNICTVYASQADYQRAADCYKALPADATNLSNLGAMYYFLGRFPEALDACRRAVEMDTERSDIKRWNLADAYVRVGDQQKAREQLEVAAGLTRERLAVNKGDARVMARHAYYDARLGRRDEALREAEAAVELGKSDSAVLYRSAVIHALLGQPAEAVTWLDRALQAHYPVKRALDDADLDSIKPLPQVKEMLRSDQRPGK